MNKFKSYDGTQMYGEIFRTPKAKKWLLLFPGFGLALDKTGPLRRLIKKITKLNYNIIAINLRGHHKSEGSFSYSEMKQDISYFINKFSKEYHDLTVFGHSISATALIDISDEIPSDVNYILLAPALRANRFPKFIEQIMIKLTNNAIFGHFILRLLLFIANVKTTNIKYIGFKNSFSNWGWCRLGINNIKNFMKQAIDFHFEFKKVKQRGIIIYGSEDALVLQIMDLYEDNINKTGLNIKCIEGMKHHFKTWLKRNESWAMDQIINSIVHYSIIVE